MITEVTYLSQVWREPSAVRVLLQCRAMQQLMLRSKALQLRKSSRLNTHLINRLILYNQVKMYLPWTCWQLISMPLSMMQKQGDVTSCSQEVTPLHTDVIGSPCPQIPCFMEVIIHVGHIIVPHPCWSSGVLSGDFGFLDSQLPPCWTCCMFFSAWRMNVSYHVPLQNWVASLTRAILVTQSLYHNNQHFRV